MYKIAIKDIEKNIEKEKKSPYISSDFGYIIVIRFEIKGKL